MTEELTEIRVADEGFLVASTIERCPKAMMIRELFKNAYEAAEQADIGCRKIQFKKKNVGGASKLAIWNSGPGMSAAELYEICNLAASLGKQKGLDANFGMGAKVASLPSNKLGMIYRSCKEGAVNEVILCQRDGIYGRMRRYDEDNKYIGDVVDVTDVVLAEGYSTDSDWTEVTLLGNHPEQDTVLDPYDGDPEQDKQWLATYLYHRFYWIEPDVEIKMGPGTHKLGDGTRPFRPITQRYEFFEKSQTVTLENGFKIHYIYDAPYDKNPSHNQSISGAITSAVSTCAIIYKNEMYDLKTGRDWSYNAPMFGITYGGKHISVHIELPDAYEVFPEAYRQFLRYKTGDQSQVKAEDFALLVQENRPQWLLEIIQSLSPQTADSTDHVRSELQKLLDQLRVKNHSPRINKNGNLQVEEGEGRGGGSGSSPTQGVNGQNSGTRPLDLSKVAKGTKFAQNNKNSERAPKIHLLSTEEEIAEKQIKGRAARYVMETGDLFINLKYPALLDMKSQLETEYASFPDVDVMREMVHEKSVAHFALKIGRAVVFALAKQLNREWDRDNVLHALEPESLSIASDDYFESLSPIRQGLGRKLRVKSDQKPLIESTSITSSAL